MSFQLTCSFSDILNESTVYIPLIHSCIWSSFTELRFQDLLQLPYCKSCSFTFYEQIYEYWKFFGKLKLNKSTLCQGNNYKIHGRYSAIFYLIGKPWDYLEVYKILKDVSFCSGKIVISYTTIADWVLMKWNPTNYCSSETLLLQELVSIQLFLNG